MHDLKSFFCISWPPSATFPHHSLKTVANFLRLRQYIDKWVTNTFSVPTEWLFSLPPFSLVVKEGVALLRELAVIWHGLQSGEDLLEHWPYLNQNTSICFSNENIHVLLTCALMKLNGSLTFGSVTQQLLKSSAKLAGQPLGMVNLCNTQSSRVSCWFKGIFLGVKWEDHHFYISVLQGNKYANTTSPLMILKVLRREHILAFWPLDDVCCHCLCAVSPTNSQLCTCELQVW